MFGLIFIFFGTFFEEVASTIGKTQVQNGKQSIYTMGFLNLFWSALIFLAIALIAPGSFIFKTASLPTFVPRVILEVAQAFLSVKAVALAARSSFSFIRSLTIPFLLVVDLILGYRITFYQFVGLAIILTVVLALSTSRNLAGKGKFYVLATAINAVLTISLYKYNITHFNSVVAEQLIVFLILVFCFWVAARFIAKENPLKFLKKPIFLLQSISTSVGSGLESFAYVFAPASIILTAKRSTAVLWSIFSGRVYFKEHGLIFKVIGFILLVVGFCLLAQ